MNKDLYTADERRLLEAWFEDRALSIEDEALLAEQGFDHDCQPYTRLDAWVGAFAVRDIQERLPNCGICREDGVILTRPIQKNRRSKKVAGAVRFLFRINWADSAPGLSWPADYHLVWLPGFERWVLTYSADSPDAMGYCDFALGAFGPDADWRETVREILVNDWRAQFDGWNQGPWAYVWGEGLVKEEEAMAWRAEAWEGHEDFWAGTEEDEGEGGGTGNGTECLVASPERQHTDVLAGPQRSRKAQRRGGDDCEAADPTCRLEAAASPTLFVRDLMSAGGFSREEAEFWADIT
jgi:hypothetical protein